MSSSLFFPDVPSGYKAPFNQKRKDAIKTQRVDATAERAELSS